MGTPKRDLETCRALVDRAEELVVKRSDGETHTVAAAAEAADGTVVTGLNVFHLNGRPCAELVAIANAAAATDAPLCRVVAVGDGGRGVLPPCGRCRQVLLDLQPTVDVILPGDNGGIRLVPVTELLPLAYSWRDHQCDGSPSATPLRRLVLATSDQLPAARSARP